MFDDYYQVLGIPRDASPDEIKKAYYSQARECHPDLNPDDTKAKNRFQRIQKAFDVLGDLTRREQYNKKYDAHFSPPPPPSGRESGATMHGAPPVGQFASARSVRRRSGGTEILKIVLGGLLGISVGWAILWFGFNRDVLGIMTPLDVQTAAQTQMQPERLSDLEAAPGAESAKTSSAKTRTASSGSAQKGNAGQSDQPKLNAGVESPTNAPNVQDSQIVNELRVEVARLKLELAQAKADQLKPSQSPPRIPDGASEFRGNRYFPFQMLMTMHKAEEHCERLGGHLARIDSSEEHEFVFELIRAGKRQDYFVDGSDEAVEGEWVYSNGQPIPFIKWDKTPPNVEPNNYQNGEHSLVIHNQEGYTPGTIADCPPGSRHAFVCEWEQGIGTQREPTKLNVMRADVANGGTRAGDRITVSIRGVAAGIRWCPPGEFRMGSPENETSRTKINKDEKQVTVRISTGFWIAEHETTQALWTAVMAEAPSETTANSKQPIRNISHDECITFCRATTELLQKSNEIPDGWSIHLPTESQWEYAARAGSTTQFHFGQDPQSLPAFAWSAANSGGSPHDVGTKLPNDWGLYDVAGNVNEWCADWYDGEMHGGVDPRGPQSGSDRVVRGGSWNYGGFTDFRSANRGAKPPSHKDKTIGFRFVVSP